MSKDIPAVGNGNVPSDDAEEISVSQLCVVVNTVHVPRAVVFPDLANNFGNPSWLWERAILVLKTNCQNE